MSSNDFLFVNAETVTEKILESETKSENLNSLVKRYH